MVKNATKLIAGVIFDMDGVISDTQSICALVESDLLKEHGINLSPDDISTTYAGVVSYEMFRNIFKNFNKELPDLEIIISERRSRVYNATRGNVRAIPGTLEFINTLANKCIPMAIASASRLDYIDMVLKELKIRNKFTSIASSQEVAHGKPEPDIFLLAAKRLGIDPEYCLVIEDGINGMIAAKRAHMRCIGLVQNKNNLDYPTNVIVSDLRNVSLDMLGSYI